MQVLRVHMSSGDHAGLIEACMRLGDASRGGDPHLWNEVLEYFGAQQSDCTQQVRFVTYALVPIDSVACNRGSLIRKEGVAAISGMRC